MNTVFPLINTRYFEVLKCGDYLKVGAYFNVRRVIGIKLQNLVVVSFQITDN